jgi:hypothetical protein
MMVDFRRSRARDVGIVLVLALLVVDGVLVVMAFRSRPEPPEVTVASAPSPSTPTATATPTSAPASTPTPTPTPTEEPAEPESARELPLSVLDASTAVRGTPGTCADGGGAIEITEDGGATWSAFEDIPDVSVLRVRITDDNLWFIGAGRDCTEGYIERSADDEGWEPSTSTGTAWHLLADPGRPDVHAPNRFQRAPCEDSGASIVELESAVGAPARLLCSDGTVHVTADNAATWNELGQVPGAWAMGVADGEPLVAAADVEGCDGLALQRVTDPEPTEVGCVEGAGDSDVALAFAGDGRTGFLLADGATWTTEDGGATWTPAA